MPFTEEGELAICNVCNIKMRLTEVTEPWWMFALFFTSNNLRFFFFPFIEEKKKLASI